MKPLFSPLPDVQLEEKPRLRPAATTSAPGASSYQPYDNRTEFQKGLDQGAKYAQGGLRGALGAGAALIGQDEFAREQAQRASEIMEPAPGDQARVSDIKQVKNMKDLYDYVSYGLGSTVASSAMGAAGGVVGGLVGGAPGAAAGMGIASGATQGGALFAEEVQRLPDRSLSELARASTIAGAGMGALDALPVVRAFERLGAGKIGKRIVGNAVRSAFEEGSTEAAQTYIERATRGFLDENYDVFDEEGRNEILNAAAMGGLIGAGLGGASGVLPASDFRNRLDDLDAQDEFKRLRVTRGADALRQVAPELGPEIDRLVEADDLDGLDDVVVRASKAFGTSSEYLGGKIEPRRIGGSGGPAIDYSVEVPQYAETNPLWRQMSPGANANLEAAPNLFNPPLSRPEASALTPDPVSLTEAASVRLAERKKALRFLENYRRANEERRLRAQPAESALGGRLRELREHGNRDPKLSKKYREYLANKERERQREAVEVRRKEARDRAMALFEGGSLDDFKRQIEVAELLSETADDGFENDVGAQIDADEIDYVDTPQTDVEEYLPARTANVARLAKGTAPEFQISREGYDNWAFDPAVTPSERAVEETERFRPDLNAETRRADEFFVDQYLGRNAGITDPLYRDRIRNYEGDNEARFDRELRQSNEAVARAEQERFDTLEGEGVDVIRDPEERAINRIAKETGTPVEEVRARRQEAAAASKANAVAQDPVPPLKKPRAKAPVPKNETLDQYMRRMADGVYRREMAREGAIAQERATEAEQKARKSKKKIPTNDSPVSVTSKAFFIDSQYRMMADGLITPAEFLSRFDLVEKYGVPANIRGDETPITWGGENSIVEFADTIKPSELAEKHADGQMKYAVTVSSEGVSPTLPPRFEASLTLLRNTNQAQKRVIFLPTTIKRVYEQIQGGRDINEASLQEVYQAFLEFYGDMSGNKGFAFAKDANGRSTFQNDTIVAEIGETPITWKMLRDNQRLTERTALGEVEGFGQSLQETEEALALTLEALRLGVGVERVSLSEEDIKANERYIDIVDKKLEREEPLSQEELFDYSRSKVELREGTMIVPKVRGGEMTPLTEESRASLEARAKRLENQLRSMTAAYVDEPGTALTSEAISLPNPEAATESTTRWRTWDSAIQAASREKTRLLERRQQFLDTASAVVDAKSQNELLDIITTRIPTAQRNLLDEISRVIGKSAINWEKAHTSRAERNKLIDALEELAANFQNRALRVSPDARLTLVRDDEVLFEDSLPDKNSVFDNPTLTGRGSRTSSRKAPLVVQRFADLPEYTPGQRTMTYAGIGSLETPPAVQALMTQVAKRLAELGYTLRSGGAEGADLAFEAGADAEYEAAKATDANALKKKKIFYKSSATDVTRNIAREIHPAPKALGPVALDLMARNTNQVFGERLDTPVDFVLAWTEDGAESTKDRSRATGGTGQAIDMASRKGIPVINLANPNWSTRLKELVEQKAAPEVTVKKSASLNGWNEGRAAAPVVRKFETKERRLLGEWLRATGIKREVVFVSADELYGLAETKVPESVRKALRAEFLGGSRGAAAKQDKRAAMYVAVNPAVRDPKLREAVLAHEFGHVVFKDYVNRHLTKDSLAGAVRDEFHEWLKKTKGKSTEEVLRMKLPKEIFDTEISEADLSGRLRALPREQVEYYLDFEEWVADNVSRWLKRSKPTPPEGRVARFFWNLANLIRSVWGVVQETEFPPAKSVDALMRGIVYRTHGVYADRWIETLSGHMPYPADLINMVDPDVVENLKDNKGRKVWVLNAALLQKLVPFSDNAISAVRQGLDTLLRPEEYRALSRAFSAQHVRPQVMRYIRDNMPEKFSQALTDTSLQIAVGYQMWLLGDVNGKPLIDLGPQAKTLYEKYDNFMEKYFGFIATHRQAEQILTALQTGLLSLRKHHKGYFVLRDRAARDTVLKRAGQTAADAYKVIAPAIEALLYPVQQRLIKTGNAQLRRLVEMMAPIAGQSRYDESYFGTKQRRTAELQDRYQRLSKDWDEEFKRQIWDALYDPARPLPKGSELEAAVGNVRKLFEYYYNYAKDHISLDHREDYFPWVMNTRVLEEQAPAFLAMLRDPKHAAEIKRIAGRWNLEPAEVPEYILNTILNQKGVSTIGNAPGRISHTPYFAFGDTRTLNFLYARGTESERETLRSWMDSNLDHTVYMYSEQLVKRVEFAKRFGRDGKEFQSMMALAQKQGASDKELKLANDFVAAMLGYHGMETNRRLYSLFGKEAPKDEVINPAIRGVLSATMVMQNLAVLGLATFSSLIDPITVGVRAGDWTVAMRAWRAGLKEVVSATRNLFPDDKKKQMSHAEQMARAIGVIEERLVMESLSWQYSSTYLPHWLNAINEGFFKLIGLNQWTQMSRTMATAGAEQFLLAHASGKRTKHSARYLEQLGLRPGDVKREKNQVLLLTREERRSASPEELARDDRVRAAIFQFVDEAIVRPSPNTRALWMSDPHFMLIGHLKSFMFAFHEQVLRRVWGEAALGNFGPSALLMSLVPAMMASNMLREAFKEGLTGEEAPDDPFFTAFWEAMQRAGLTGIFQIFFDAKRDVEYGGTAFDSLLGPTWDNTVSKLPQIAAGDEKAIVDQLPLQNIFGSVYEDLLPIE